MTELNSHTPPGAAPAPITSHPLQELADRIYQATPTPAPSREMYPVENLIRSDLDRNLGRLAPRLRLSDADQVAEREKFGAMVRATGLSENPALAVAVHSAWTTERMRAARPGGETAVPDQEVDLAGEEAWDAARRQFGNEFDPLLARARKWIASDPLLLHIMSLGATGSNSQLVVSLMEFVQSHGLGR